MKTDKTFPYIQTGFSGEKLQTQPKLDGWKENKRKAADDGDEPRNPFEKTKRKIDLEIFARKKHDVTQESRVSQKAKGLNQLSTKLLNDKMIFLIQTI